MKSLYENNERSLFRYMSVEGPLEYVGAPVTQVQRTHAAMHRWSVAIGSNCDSKM